MMGPRVATHVARLDALIAGLDAKARDLLASRANLSAVAQADAGAVVVPVDDRQHEELAMLSRAIDELKDLRWRYAEGPSGKGRASLGMANSTGCSSVWGSTYPYNPYPFPWVNHLFQDAPSVAIGVFEGHMRKMADGFITVRRAEKLLDGSYDAKPDETAFARFDWQQFNDDEFAMCPPIIAMGGDGAMLDIGFQNLSRLLASGKPIRVVVLDTQVYSNTGGQACTSGFTGQVADMSAWGAAQHGKTEVRKELSLIAIAHRGVYVHQTSQASASHLIGGLLRGLQKRRPVLINVYTPCPVEHGLADDWSQHAARLALESRAFPFLTYDPDAGSTLSDCLSLDGNPAVDDVWPAYSLTYVDETGSDQTTELPLTIADWAATEGRFKRHFTEVAPPQWTDDMVLFHEYLALVPDERDGRVPFIWAVDAKKQRRRLRVSPEIVALARERIAFWSQLREMAGLEVAPAVRDRLLGNLEDEFAGKVEALRRDYETKLADLRAAYPRTIARRLAAGLLHSAGGARSVNELLAGGATLPDLSLPATMTSPVPSVPAVSGMLAGGAAPNANGAGASSSVAVQVVAEAASVDDDLAMDPCIDTAKCTTCNECTNLNRKLFAYNTDKQAYIKDAKAGTFAQIVQAAEKCPVAAIHPGTPLNPKEKDLAKWIERAKPFN
jgi:pyruvate-ferredoxin/flavodoxin oxidoreductase